MLSPISLFNKKLLTVKLNEPNDQRPNPKIICHRATFKNRIE